MKLLLLHVDYIRFKPLKKALKNIDELSPGEGERGGEAKDALAVLIAVEKRDSNAREVVKKLVENVLDVASKVNAKTVVLYPYAHLSRELGKPSLALEILKGAEKELGNVKGIKVIRAPFGYYKELELKVKGHPLSELSREIVVDSKEGGSEEVEEDSKQLLREISKSVLDKSKLKDNDHRILGQQMDLFSFSETAPGSVFWHGNGLVIRNELINFWREVHRKAGYKEIATPQILDSRLWKISGHWGKYKENLFLTDYEKRVFAIKPMNCPGAMMVYRNSPKSYRDLPLRLAEMGLVHRKELSGVLAGLFRVVQFTQDDAHIFCSEKQLESEVRNIMDIVELIYKKTFNFDYHIELSTRPKKRMGEDKVWDKAEKGLKNALDKNKVKYKINKGDGAFYGPKIDFHLKDSLGRTWQCATIQLDMQMPERFDIEFVDKDNKRKRPIVLHRTIFGSIERFIGILLEHYNGRLPLWLAPKQVRILNFTDRNTKHSEKILKELTEKIPGLRIDSDFRQTTIQAKVKDAEIMRVPYIIVLGDREEKDNNLAVRVKGSKKIENLGLDEFVKRVKSEIEDRR